MSLSALQIQKALAYHFDYIANTCLPNCFIAGYEMDFAIITKAGYLIEIEIKRTIGDYYADKSKDKWKCLKAKQLYYAVPEALAPKVLPSLDPRFGLIIVRETHEWPKTQVENVRKATPIKGAKKLEDHEIIYLTSKLTYRYWREAYVYEMKDVPFTSGAGI